MAFREQIEDAVIALRRINPAASDWYDFADSLSVYALDAGAARLRRNGVLEYELRHEAVGPVWPTVSVAAVIAGDAGEVEYAGPLTDALVWIAELALGGGE